MTQLLKVGSRVRTDLYGRGRGVIYGIHGEQRPETIQRIMSGAMVTGGSAEFDIVFDNGTETKRLPESILHGVQWTILEGMADAEEIASLHKLAFEEDRRKRVEAEESAQRFREAVAALKIDPRYAKLRQVSPVNSGGKLVAANLRIEFKAAFPGVKFSVTSDYNSVRIGWTDGPTTDEVKKITGKYSGGHFDGMTDSYEHERSPFTNVFGSADYIFPTRCYSVPVLVDAVIAVSKEFGCEPIEVKVGYEGSAYLDNSNDEHQHRNIYDFLEKRYHYEAMA